MPAEIPVAAAGMPPRRLRTDVALTFGGKLAGLVLATASSVVVARALGPSGRGTLAVAYALTLLLVQFGSLGLATANPYFTARDPRVIGRVIANSIWLSMGLGLVLALVGLAVKARFPAVVEGVHWAELTVAVAGIPGALAATFLQGVLLGQGRMVAYNGVELAQSVLVLLALVGGFALLGIGVLGALAIMVVGSLGAAVAYWVLLCARRPRLRRPDLALAGQMLRYGFRIYVAALLAFLVIRVDLLLVNSYLGPVQAGLYAVVAALAEGMVLLPTVVGVNLFPRVARGGEDDMSARVFRSMAVLFGGLCLLSLPLAGPAIRFLYGEQFTGAASLYYWLLPGIFSLGMLTILSHHFAGRGFPLEAMLIWFIGLGLNLAINLAFLADGGTYVAALASSVAYTVLLVLHMRLFARESGGYGALRPRMADAGRFVTAALGRAPWR